ncbi:hypothetical protein B7494_g3513 [Chlorociboria aeruginascens]|nr:hypothetical protein B7494_g3513 [Chlorociboria aeruginascens]
MSYVAETPRIWLEPLTVEKHLVDYHEMWNNPEALVWSTQAPKVNLEESRAWMLTTLPSPEHPTDQYAILLRPVLSNLEPWVNEDGSPKIVGIVGTFRRGGEGLETSYCMNIKYWGRGYATEAFREFLKVFWRLEERKDVERLVAKIDPDNVISEKIVRKAGASKGEVMKEVYVRPVDAGKKRDLVCCWNVDVDGIKGSIGVRKSSSMRTFEHQECAAVLKPSKLSRMEALWRSSTNTPAPRNNARILAGLNAPTVPAAPPPYTHSQPRVANAQVPLSRWARFRRATRLSDRTIANLGWIIALFSMCVTAVALSPAFVGQNISQEALELAKWTAMKDYIENCETKLAQGISSSECLKALTIDLPPPPYLKVSPFTQIAKRFSSSRFKGLTDADNFNREIIQRLSELITVLLVVSFVILGFLIFRDNRKKLREWKDREEALDASPIHQLRDFSTPPRQPSPFIEPQIIQVVPRSTASAVQGLESGDRTGLVRRINSSIPANTGYKHYNLCEAIKKLDLDEFRLRIDQGDDVNAHYNLWPHTPLKFALLLDDTSPKVQSTTLIKKLWREEKKEMAQILIEMGADLEMKDRHGETALLLAASQESQDAVALLVREGASVNARLSDNRTALHLATMINEQKYTAMCRSLLEAGADAMARDDKGRTPLHYAVNAKHRPWYDNRPPAMISLLIQYGADPLAVDNSEHIPRTEDGVTLLQQASNDHDFKMIRKLLAKGANVNDTDEFGRTALHHAINHAGPVRATGALSYQKLPAETVQLLISNGAHVNAMAKDGELPITACAIEASRNKDQKYIKYNPWHEVAKQLLFGGSEVRIPRDVDPDNPIYEFMVAKRQSVEELSKSSPEEK